MKFRSAFIQFIKFAIVGLLNTFITLLTFYLLFEIFHVQYLFASITGYIFGIINSYFGNKLWTFRVTKVPVHTELGKFIAVSLFGLFLNTLFIWGFVEFFGIKPVTAQILTIGIVVIVTFSANKYWVFKSKPG